jgi:hypothetical protein
MQKIIDFTYFFPMCVFVTAVPIIKLFAWREGDSGVYINRGV